MFHMQYPNAASPNNGFLPSTLLSEPSVSAHAATHARVYFKKQQCYKNYICLALQFPQHGTAVPPAGNGRSIGRKQLFPLWVTLHKSQCAPGGAAGFTRSCVYRMAII